MKDMVYISPRGKRVAFDDYTDNTEEFGTYWSQTCRHCHNKYHGILNNKFCESPSDTIICGVKGCNNVGEGYYVDFKANEVVFQEDE
nr:MAG TPA: Cytochrome C' [Caudoviricetes sp.]